MITAVATVLDRIAAEYPGPSVRELELEETIHFERDLLIRRLRERECAFLLATSDNDFVVDEGATVEDMAGIAVEALREFGAVPGSVALSLRFEHSKAANSWKPNTLYGGWSFDSRSEDQVVGDKPWRTGRMGHLLRARRVRG